MRAATTESVPHSANERRLRLLGYGAYGLLGWTSVLLPSLIGDIQDSFGATDSDFGIVFFFAALFYGLGGLGGGFLTERIGPRIVLTVAFLFLGVTLFGGSVVTVWVLFAATAAIGKAANGSIDAGFGALFLSVFTDRRGSALSMLHLCYAGAAFLAPAVVGGALALGVKWRVLFVLGALAALAGLVALNRLDWSLATPGVHSAVAPEAGDEPGGIMSPAFLLLAAAMALYEAQVLGVTAWIVRYFEDQDVGYATLALSAFWIGVCVSRYLARWIAKWTTPKRLGIGLLTGTTIFFLLALLSPWPMVALGLLVVAGFFSGPIYPLLIAIGGDFFPERLGRVSGGLTAAATVGGLTYPPLVGLISDDVSLRMGLLIGAAMGFPAVAALATAFRLRPARNQANLRTK